jgi:hypothetical protein
VDRRIAVAGIAVGFGIGLALGLKIAGGMGPLQAKVVEVPVRIPCRNCAERERLEAAGAGRTVPQSGAPATAPPPDPVAPTARTFSPLSTTMAEVATNGDSSVPYETDPDVSLT